MDLPPFVPYPPATLQKDIAPEEWLLCIDAWIFLARRTLSLPSKALSFKFAKDNSLSQFLISYAQENSIEHGPRLDDGRSKDLRGVCFLLIHRLTTDVDPPPSLLEWSFLGDFSTVYAKTSTLQYLITSLWRRFNLDQQLAMHESKNYLGKSLDARSKNQLNLEQDLRRAVALLKASQDYGRFLMVGSDLLDSLIAAWSSAPRELQKKLTTITYLALLSLLLGEKPNVSLLLDHLYSLKTDTEKRQPVTSTSSLLSDIIQTTPFFQKLQDLITGQDAKRATSMISYLEHMKAGNGARPRRRVRRKIDKGKGGDDDEYGHGTFGGVHVHKMSLVTQIQDLFPDLGSGFIVKMLDEYDDNAEEVTAHLLENSLPSHLRDADRNEQFPIIDHQDEGIVSNLAPHSTPPLLPSRKNIFDDDDLDRLAVDTSKLHFGRKNPNMTADDLLADRSSAPSKAAILSALASFDSDDDERDDTYDVEDVGGTVDSAIPGSDDVDADLRDNNEEPLFRAYKMNAETFDRDSSTRRSKARLALKSETGMTDEAIEGWAIMIGRDSRRLRRLEAKFSTFSGGQRELASTAYREGATESGTEDSEGGGRGRGGLRGRGRGRGPRGRGGGGEGRGGNVAGLADDKATQVARQRKDANKGSRANHNRRDQRARKMTRGGLPG